MRWVIATVVALVVFAQQPTKSPEAIDSAKGKSSQIGKQANAGNQDNHPSEKAITTAAIPDQPPSAALKDSAQQTDRDADTQKRLVTFNGLLVIVGVLQFFALIGQVTIYCRQAKIMAHQRKEMTRQRLTMRAQLEAMKQQLLQMQESGKQTDRMIEQATKEADAVQKSAQALMDGQRAWLLVENLQIFDGKVDPVAVAIQNAGDGSVNSGHLLYRIVSKATFEIHNFGRTPGRIVSVGARMEIGDSRDKPPNPKEVYEPTPIATHVAKMLGNSTETIEEHIVPQNGFRIDCACISPFAQLTDEKLTRIKNDADFLWAYGVVRYKDVYDREHETRFCYRYVVPPEEPLCHFCLRGPEEYNKAT